MTPSVSILVPCYNEVSTIRNLLAAVAKQDYPLSDLEVIIADGMSIDGTRETIRDFIAAHLEPRIRLLDNPERSIPAALNRALAEAEGDAILRLDAHSVPADDYVSRCLGTLEETSAANVGGQWVIEPGGPTWIARSIAAAAADPLGAGDARYRTGGRAGAVDTVPFGAFPRTWLERVGGYDETLAANEDYDLNWRIRQQGGVVWFDPKIRCTYIARPGLAALGRQYLRYGFWKARMLLRHPSSLRWRQALPPIFVLSLLALAGLAVLVPGGWIPLLTLAAAYLAVLLVRGLLVARDRRRGTLVLGLPIALGAIHICWGTGFLAGAITGLAAPSARG